MAKKTCENYISELRRFFRWLHRSKEFNWRKPEDYDELKTNVKDMQEERTRIDDMNVEVYLPEELEILNKYATPLDRVLLLLGLNCGFEGSRGRDTAARPHFSRHATPACETPKGNR